MKKLLMIAVLATLGATAMAVPPSLQPPITTGGDGNTSSTEVRITANVVEGIAVNEASPIDFGNLARGMYTGTVNQNIPGKVHVKGSADDQVKLSLNTDNTNLVWTGTNGTNDKNPQNATKATIENVSVYGISTTGDTISLGSTGEITKTMTASFTAGTQENDNLGPKQKLGSYVGTVVVKAEKTNP